MSYRRLKHIKDLPSCIFSICSIITDEDEYNVMKQSFENCGFIDGCEYIIADNTQGNAFDAYQAVNRFIREAIGKYLVIVHQDVRCIDSRATLERCLAELDQKDNNWAVCGNAGGIGYHQLVHYINNAGTVVTCDNLPAKVSSLDENLLIINTRANMLVSADLQGFHLYGTDACIIADFMGYNCYVIPFMVKHLSLGNLPDLRRNLDHFLDRYGKKLHSRYVETTATKFYLSNARWKNRLFNSPVFFFFIKAGQRAKLLLKRAAKKNPHKKTMAPG